MTAHAGIDARNTEASAVTGGRRRGAVGRPQASNSAANRKLYKSRVPIYPKEVDGRFRHIKWAMMAFTLSIYYLVPWLRWDRGPSAPHQAVLVDLAHERLYFFFIEIWPQEVYYITGLLILAAVAAVSDQCAVRAACGAAIPVRRRSGPICSSGSRPRSKETAAPAFVWPPRPGRLGKIAKRVSKHAVWLVFAVATGGAWVFYFSDAPTLAHQLFTGVRERRRPTPPSRGLPSPPIRSGGLMREQVCTYMCPWPRIQAAMTDSEALSVTYRRDRGEPRGAAQERRALGWARQLHRLQPMRRRLPDGHRYPRRIPAGMHQLRTCASMPATM